MATASSSLGTQFHEELTCSICLELFTRPKVLPCQHTFCQDCLQDHAGRGGAFQCPNCRQQVRLPPQGVTGLPDNLMAANMCEILQQQTSLSGPAARGTGHHHGNHREREQHSQRVRFGGKRSGTGQFGRHSAPAPAPAPIPAERAARGRGHRHGNQWQGEPQSQYHRTTIGKSGFGPGQFYSPSGVTVSEEGEIFVADRDNQRIQVFTLQGTFVRQFPTVVPRREEKIKPEDVALDGKGNLWVVGRTEFAQFAVQYNKQGRVLRKFDLQESEWYRGVAVDTRRNHILITQITGHLLNLHDMGWPCAVAMAPQGQLVVTDIENHTVSIFPTY
ncbi:tripartite motif-containing protein 3-like [Branchiostoma floridae]|uniref:RING-type E3 ubiquitin transferase n=1 Tax=Branchiostoma floridae TaxID=7739 RepID=A0A9J7KGT2_BRAFL|nr:tripartite motif-containing protein 3-like [Branchiostoma floridae]